VLFNKDREAIAIDRLDEIVGCPQIKAHGFIVDNSDHDDRYLRQRRIALQLL
jgi:hypothetical protein